MRFARSSCVAVVALVLLAAPATAQARTTSALAAYRPKGMPPLLNAQTAGRHAGRSSATDNYLYVYGREYASASGAAVTLMQSQPRVDPSDDHSLAELAAQSEDGQQIVEVGWTVAPGLNGDKKPHLFVFHWVDDIPTCYNACGFVQVSSTIRPGDPVAVNTTGLYKINFAKAKWWIYYDGHKVGYFPASLWSGRYTQIGLVQTFGEVDAGSDAPCTDMGNGTFGSARGSATISKFGLIGSASTSSLSVTSTRPDLYNAGAIKPRSFRFGGPGSC